MNSSGLFLKSGSTTCFRIARDLIGGSLTIVGATITGAVITLNQIAAELTRVLGREITLVTVPLEGAKAAMEGQGMPPWLVAHMAGLVPFVSDGGMGDPSDWVEKLSGHAPRTLAEFVTEHKAAFGG